MRALVLAVVLAGCLQDNLVLCDNGLACAEGLVCDDVHSRCVSPDQIAACSGLADGANCMLAAQTGGCFDGVCLPRGCGNGIIEPGEVCDDGNQTSGDGCSGDCRSNETCGNGVVDADEQCDDGNLVSKDGCDSRCLTETTTWTTVEIAPTSLPRTLTAYDPIRGRLVAINFGTWEWDGTTWTSITTSMPTGGVGIMMWDPDRGHVIAVSGSTTQTMIEWDGTQWTPFSTGTGPTKIVRAGAYDVSRHEPIIVESDGVATIESWTLDAQSAWTQMPSAPPLSQASDWTAGYDPMAHEVVIVTDGFEAVFNGSVWLQSVIPIAGSGISLTTDETNGVLVAVENAGGNAVFTRQASWQASPDASMCVDPTSSASERTLFYDSQASTVRMFDTRGVRLCTESAGTWTQAFIDMPFAPVAAIPDPKHRRIVIIHDPDPIHGVPSQMWTWDGTWHQLPMTAMPPSRVQPAVTYDETRGAAILYGGSPLFGCTVCTSPVDTWSFDGTAWTELDNNGPQFASWLTYDPTRRLTILADTSTNLYRLDQAWTLDRAGPQEGQVLSLAWDPSNHAFAAIVVSLLGSDLFYDIVDGVWTLAKIAPQGGFQMISDDRAGELVLIGEDAWERKGTAWTMELSGSPGSGNFAYDPADGQIIGFGNGYLRVRDRVSATPLETCVDGVDADGDGLAGCADPDCWWACAEPCPPNTTCAP